MNHDAVPDADPSGATGGRPTAARRGRFVLAAVAGAALALAAPALAQVAQVVFDDVAAGSPFRGDVEAIVGAGITSGCDVDSYCPSEAVSRGQMAAFLRRTGGAVSSSSSATTLAADGGVRSGTPVVVEVTTPGVDGGTQYVVLQGAVTVLVDGNAAGCPCEVEAFVFRDSDGDQGGSSYAVLPREAAGSGTTSVSLPVTFATSQPAGRTDEYRVAVFVEGVQAPAVRAEGTVSAITAPFGDGS